MQLAGISRGCGQYEDVDTIESPLGGIIDRDSDGRPTGILRERAVELILTVMGKKSHSEMKSFISDGLSLCAKKGLTAVQTNDANALSVYRDLLAENSLPIRVFLTPNYEEVTLHDVRNLPINMSTGSGIIEEQLTPHRPSCMPLSSASISKTTLSSANVIVLGSSSSEEINFAVADSRLIVERLKIYADGSLGAETAALRKAPADIENQQESINETLSIINIDEIDDSAISAPAVSSEYSGILTHSKIGLQGMVSHARNLGFRVEVHAIGDAAVDQVGRWGDHHVSQMTTSFDHSNYHSLNGHIGPSICFRLSPCDMMWWNIFTRFNIFDLLCLCRCTSHLVTRS